MTSKRMRTAFRKIACSSLVLLGVGSASATDPVWINNGILTEPPQVDAITFINNGTIDIATSEPFETANTLNYTNSGIMEGAVGFNLRLNPSVIGVPAPSANFNNRVGSVISAQALGTTITPNGFEALNYLYIDATNFWNQGILNIQAGGEMVVRGGDMDLSRGGAGVEPVFGIGSINDHPDNEFLPDEAIDDLYWGQTNQGFFSSQILTEQGPFLVASAPNHQVQSLAGQFGTSFQLINPVPFAYTNLVNSGSLTLTNIDGSTTNITVISNITPSGGAGFTRPRFLRGRPVLPEHQSNQRV